MWFWLALGSAVLGALDLVLNKRSLNKVSAAVLTWSLFAFSIPLVAYFALRNGMPSLNQLFFLGVIGSSLTFVFAKTVSNETLKQNLASKILPLTAFSGLFTYVFGLIFLSESIRPIPLLGIFSVVLGSYILNADQAKEDFWKPFKLLFTNKGMLLFLFAIMLTSITSIFDKIGVKNTEPVNSAFTLLAENILMIAILTPYLMSREATTWLKQLRGNLGALLVNGSIYSLVSLLIFEAFAGGPVALVLAVKRMQIFFVLVLGYLFFKDRPTKLTWAATLVMVLGVLMIKLG